MKIETLLTRCPRDKEGCRIYRECHIGRIDLLLLTTPLCLILLRTARSMRMVKYQGTGNKPGDTGHHHPTCRKQGRRCPTQVQWGANFVPHPTLVEDMHHRSVSQVHLPVPPSKPQIATKDQMGQTCLFFIFPTTSQIWTCIICLARMEIC